MLKESSSAGTGSFREPDVRVNEEEVRDVVRERMYVVGAPARPAVFAPVQIVVPVVVEGWLQHKRESVETADAVV